MKKILLVVLLFLLTAPFLAQSAGLVPCDTNCKIGDFFTMLVNVYKFIVFKIATPLAIIAITIGAIFMLISAGNPNLFGTGKKILWVAIIGLVLVFGSYAIIGFILTTIGFHGNWTTIGS